MNKNNEKKTLQLGMPIGTASNRLRKLIIFDLLKKSYLNVCHQCETDINSVDDLSIEHITPWLDSEKPLDLFFDLNNIGFSHLSCNVGARRHQEASHGTRARYERYGCRCRECTDVKVKSVDEYRKRKKMNM